MINKSNLSVEAWKCTLLLTSICIILEVIYLLSNIFSFLYKWLQGFRAFDQNVSSIWKILQLFAALVVTWSPTLLIDQIHFEYCTTLRLVIFWFLHVFNFKIVAISGNEILKKAISLMLKSLFAISSYIRIFSNIYKILTKVLTVSINLRKTRDLVINVVSRNIKVAMRYVVKPLTVSSGEKWGS